MTSETKNRIKEVEEILNSQKLPKAERNKYDRLLINLNMLEGFERLGYQKKCEVMKIEVQTIELSIKKTQKNNQKEKPKEQSKIVETDKNLLEIIKLESK